MPAYGRLPKTEDLRDYGVHILKQRMAMGLSVPIDRPVTDADVLDQGQEGTCCAAGLLGLLNAASGDPGGRPKFTGADIDPFFDRIPGHGPRPDGGAEVRNALKLAKSLGYIDAYAPLTTEAEITDWFENHGYVLWGTDWTNDMESPDPDGRVHPTGAVAGGHCYYGRGDVQGYDDVNSWGLNWSLRGRFYVSKADVQGLLDNGGEAWAVTVPAPVPPAPPAPPVPPTPPAPVPPAPPAPAPVPAHLRVILTAAIRGLEAIVRQLKQLLVEAD